MKRRIAGNAAWLKALVGGLIWVGLTYKQSSLVAFAAVVVFGAFQMHAGHREQVRMSPQELSAMLWTAVVYDNGVWVNPETPEQGVERLAGPHKRAMGRAS